MNFSTQFAVRGERITARVINVLTGLSF